MALRKEAEAVLDLIKDPQEREAQRRLFEQFPALQEAVLAQSDYNRKQDELRTQKESFETDKGKWLNWYEGNKAQYEADMKAKAEADARVLELQNKLAAGGDVTQDEMKTAIEAQVKAALSGSGYISKADLDAAVKKAQDEATAQVRAHDAYLMEVNRAGRRYEREFSGKEFDEHAFNKFVADGQYGTVQQAYDAYVAKDRADAAEAAKKAEIDAAVKKATEEAEARVRAEITSKAGIPGANAYPETAPGPLQTYIAPKEDPAKGDYTLGQMTAAKLAAQELRADGKIAPA